MMRGFVAIVVWMAAMAPAHATPTTPAAQAACDRFSGIDQLLDTVLQPYQGQQDPTAEQTRIAVLALRNASTKINALAGAKLPDDLASALSGYAQAASAYADAVATGGGPDDQNQAATALDASKAETKTICDDGTPLTPQS